QEVFRTSVSVALNILGIEHMRDEHHEAAYSCFKTAADRGYSKAQFNVGLCYEHGRGIERDPAKAMLYYRRAAYQGHSMAQYRCAKWLLRHWPRADRDGAWEAVALLEQAATLGLTQAQAYLGVLYLKGLQPGKHRALKYLQLAAKNGDSQSRYHVGVCYEKGFGVPRNLLEARKHYQQSAAAGNKSAQERMRAMAQEELTGISVAATRAFSSSPCLESLDSGPVRSLFRSWSTGNLRGLSCRTTPALLDCCLLELQPLVFSPGIAIS
uniref:DAP3 binding cell death enhancer 1 n=1 Tax=Sphenodon punctatus TaxID=8508 RepID=A0A8D0G6G3_SPHPU